jgi:hypothetical protein
VNDEEIRLLRDRIGYGARAGVRAPVRIANLKGVAKILGLPAHDHRPTFRKVKAHGQGNEENLLALELLVIGFPFRMVVETLVFRQRATGQHKPKRDSKHHSQFHWILPF